MKQYYIRIRLFFEKDKKKIIHFQNFDVNIYLNANVFFF